MLFDASHNFCRVISMKQWTSLIALWMMLLFAGAADGLMERLGPAGFLAVGLPLMAAAWRLLQEAKR